MRSISTRAHGAADYLVGIILIVAPYLFGFADGGVAQWLPMILGVALIVYSLITDYELAVARIIPMPVHLWLDGLSGALLLVSPWLFGFAENVWVPHVVVGLIEIGAALTTRTEPDTMIAATRI